MRTAKYDINRALEITKGINKDVKEILQEGGEKVSTDNMRSVFLVIVVDPKTAKVVVREEVVAKGEDEAKLKAVMGKNIGDLDKMDIGCTCLIKDFIRPRKETQKVTISKEGEQE